MSVVIDGFLSGEIICLRNIDSQIHIWVVRLNIEAEWHIYASVN